MTLYKTDRRGLPTSMLDLAFVLVMMFLLISTLAQTTSTTASEDSRPIPITPPERSGKNESPGLTLPNRAVISLDRDGQVFVNGTPTEMAHLSKKLTTLAPPQLELQADVEVPFGAFATALSKCHETGIRDICIAYRKE